MKYTDLHLDGYAQQDPLMILDVSTLKGPPSHGRIYMWTTVQKPVLLLDLSTPQRLVLKSWMCQLNRGMSCTYVYISGLNTGSFRCVCPFRECS
jgi:hypothetical protein